MAAAAAPVVIPTCLLYLKGHMVFFTTSILPPVLMRLRWGQAYSGYLYRRHSWYQLIDPCITLNAEKMFWGSYIYMTMRRSAP